MSTFTLKQNDLEPYVSATLTNSDDTAINLTGASSVQFVLRRVTSTTTEIRAACTVVSAAAGTVKYTWVLGDTDTVGVYDQEFEIVWPTNRPQTVPNSGYNTLTIEDDLG